MYVCTMNVVKCYGILVVNIMKRKKMNNPQTSDKGLRRTDLKVFII